MKENKKDFEITGTDSKPTNQNDVITSNDKNNIQQNDNESNVEKDFYTYAERIPKEIEWIWKPYIVRGNINIIQGDAGLGKSFLTTWLLASISNGDKIPFSNECFEIGNSLLQNAEDDPDATIWYRLNSNGADFSKIGFINEDKKTLSVKDLSRIEKVLKEFNPEVIILDPIQAYIGADMNDNTKVREALRPIKNLAQKYNCAVILIGHLNKNKDNAITKRGLGATDLFASARSVILIAENPDNEDERLFVPIKSNLAVPKEKVTLSYKINDNGKIEWLENKGRINPDKYFASDNDKDTKQEYAKNFIIGCLANKDVLGTEWDSLIKLGNFKPRTFNEARSSLSKAGIIKYSNKNNLWSLSKDYKVQSCKDSDNSKNTSYDLLGD